MGSDRHHDVRPGDTTLTGDLPVGVERGDQAFGAATGDHTAGAGVTMHHVQHHGDDLRLELRGRRVHIPLQDVRVRELAEDLAEVSVVLMVTGVQTA